MVIYSLIEKQKYNYFRMAQWLDADTLKSLIVSEDENEGSGFGAKIKVNLPNYIDYSQVILPEKRKKRHKSIDISYQPPPPPQNGKHTA